MKSEATVPNRRHAFATAALQPVIGVWSRALIRRQQRFVRAHLGNSDSLARLAAGSPLPRGYGVGANERVIEIPWLLAQNPFGKMLDAGSSLNHAEYLDHLQPVVSDLHIVTLAYEGSAYPERGISLRNLPYDKGCFDTVASISTLEHIGMDNSGYGSNAPPSADPARESERAVRELARVLNKGGRLLLTVPYGRREVHKTFRQFDRADLDRLIDAAEPTAIALSIYRYGAEGWQLSDLDQAANASYRTDFAAEAVACVCLTR
jgi:SAM-dependent methyltransferase